MAARAKYSYFAKAQRGTKRSQGLAISLTSGRAGDEYHKISKFRKLGECTYHEILMLLS